MTSQQSVPATERGSPEAARERLLAGVPVKERRLDLAGIETPVLEGGVGSPLVLLHGPGEAAAKWRWVFPALCEEHRVVAPDLPGHGASKLSGSLDPDRVLDWLEELIELTCTSPPTVVGQIIGGAIAARFAADRGHRLARLVLVDTLGLAPFQPAPEFGAALAAFLEQPTDPHYDALWNRCAYDLDRLRERTGALWGDFKVYNLDRARTPTVQQAMHALMEQFAMSAIPAAKLGRIDVPTSLIWGRHDLATPLEVAEAASRRYGWPLEVIEQAADDPPFEQPEAFVGALRRALEDA